MSRAHVTSAVALCALLAVTLSACGASTIRARAVAGITGGPTAAHNKAEAQAEAARLVSMASLPPGAVRVKSGPTGLNGPAMGTPQTSQLVDSSSYYRVSMSLATANAWFERNPQHGFSQAGTSGTTDFGNPTGYGFEYDLAPQPHWSWGTANLEIGLAPEGSRTTVIRVDGVAQWINPTPIRDTTSGPAIRVTISGGCPATDRGVNDISNPNAPDLNYQLLPVTAPTAALRCTYNGMSGPSFTLATRQHLNATQASAAARKIRALPLGSSGAGVISCPMDDASATIIVFSYPGRPDVDIWQHTSGCPSTDNGHIVSSWF